MAASILCCSDWIFDDAVFLQIWQLLFAKPSRRMCFMEILDVSYDLMLGDFSCLRCRRTSSPEVIRVN